MKTLHLASTLMLAAVLLLLGSQPLVAGPHGITAALGTPPLEPGLLAYVKEDPAGLPVLYFANADGTNERAIRSGVSSVVDWSSSGRYLAAVSGTNLLVLDAAGSQVAAIPVAVTGHYAWSPVADVLLAATEQPPADVSLRLYAPDGSLTRALDAPHGVTTLYNEVSWSPDGSQVIIPGCVGCNGTYFDAQPSTARHLWLVDTDGTPAHQLTNRSDVIEDGPHWSPDGARILFFERCSLAKPCPANAGSGSWVMRGDGAHRRLLVDGYEASWSPDGRHLVFLRDRYVGSGISPVAGTVYVGDAAGKHASAIVDSELFPWPLGWSRDSGRVFLQDDLGATIVEMDGADLIRVDNVSGVVEQYMPSATATPTPAATAAPEGKATPVAVATPTVSDLPASPSSGLPADPPADSADFSGAGLALDAAGTMYVSDCGTGRILKVVDAHTVAVVVGSGPGGFDAGFKGDGGPATRAQIQCPYGVLFDSAGNLVLADHGNSRIRKVSPRGIIQTIAGTGHPNSGWGSYGGDGGPAMQANLNDPTAIAYGPDGTLYISDRDNDRVRAVAPDGQMRTVAGTDAGGGFSGDGGPAAKARVDDPAGIAIAPDGTIYFADGNNRRIRKVTPDGIITTIAGNGKDVSRGDGGPAIKASLADPEALLLDADGTLYVTEGDGDRVRAITPDGLISTFAGTGKPGNTGDGGLASKATLDGVGNPDALAIDDAGTIYISSGDHIRAVDPSGVISTVLFQHP